MAKTERRRKTAAKAKPAKLPKTIETAVRAAEDKQAVDITVMDLANAQGFTDYFIICSGTNTRQIRAIADGIVDALKALGQKPAHLEGYDRSEWVLVDYFDFVVHVFSPESRAFYGLERLWGNAEHIAVTPAP